MPVIDLTHTLREGMPVYPGTEPPQIVRVNTLSEHGFREKLVTFTSHTGTHIDAPAHMLPFGRTLEQYPVDAFVGPACVYRHPVDVGRFISYENLLPLSSLLQDTEFLLLATGWDQYWGESQYFGDFPILIPEAAEWLTQFGLKGIGLDVLSADSLDSTQFQNHRMLLKHDMLIIENLTRLDTIGRDLCEFICLPLHLADADGAPVRAMARTE